MMHAIVKRDSLATFFANLDPTALNRALTPIPAPKTVVMLFEHDSPEVGELPVQIVVPDDEIETLFAWAATYLDVLSPVTSFVEVIPTTELLERQRHEIGANKRNAMLAVVVIEAAIQVARSRARQGPGLLAASLRCLSWVYFQGVVSGGSPEHIRAALERWVRVRSALTGITLPYPLEHVTNFWVQLLPLFGAGIADESDNRLLRLNSDVLERGMVGFERWAILSPAFGNYDSFESIMRGPRQQRIELLDRAARSLPNDDGDRELHAAFCGYLGSRVADGALDVWSAVLDRSARFPTMPLWFAFYCGVNPASRLLDYDRSLPRRLLRELGDGSYDVDARELLVLARGKSPVKNDAQSPAPGTLRARLGPGMVGCFLVRETPNASEESRSRDPHPPRDTLRPPFADERQAHALVTEARIASERAAANLIRLQQLFTTSDAPGPKQQDLELRSSPEPPRKNTRRRGKS